MNFTKWQACGNHFIFINGFHKNIEPLLPEIPKMCNPYFGIGADGVIFLLPSKKADIRMRMFNTDGSEAEMCGNGIRAFAKWAYELGLVSSPKFSVETGKGILHPEILPDGMVKVDMGAPILEASKVPVTGFGDNTVISQDLYNSKLDQTFKITAVSMGNPHCVIYTDDAEKADVEHIGPVLETDSHFPNKTNVEFVQVLGDHKLRMRVWERGCGITMACGTGTCASVVSSILNHYVKDYADVELDGGTLHIAWNGDPNGHVVMTGPAEKVYEGRYLLPKNIEEACNQN